MIAWFNEKETLYVMFLWVFFFHYMYYRWSELQVWPPGALVKHVRGLFKAEGVNVTAEPGNSMHGRFYVSTVNTN